jgi:hypothetical protein
MRTYQRQHKVACMQCFPKTSLLISVDVLAGAVDFIYVLHLITHDKQCCHMFVCASVLFAQS